ncbi:MAG: serine/threonine-protein phosphatase [Gloeobacteraceae cyanobacterium ES-bin-144]|nr:serine/threonine-protein phosphatase [Verrucomicrobiales bacterium]
MPDASILYWAALTHSGSRKPCNDDSLIAFASSPSGAETLGASGSRSLANHDLVFAVSDGMGGGKAGDLASSLLLQRMSEIIPETFKIAAAGFYPDCLDHLADAMQSVHEHINAAATSEHTRGMAATLALAWFTPTNLYIANVGDSRIYISRNGKLDQLSRDHATTWGQWKRGELSEIQYRSHPRRSALYEVIGGGHSLIHPHFAAIPFQPGDRFLICSDGLTEGLWERHISDALTAPLSAEKISQILLNRAIDNAGIDDTTLIVIHVNAAIPESLEEN